MDYLEKNKDFWESGCPAENPESHVFRTYGRILKPELGITGEKHEKFLDFACGEGANMLFFKKKGFDVYGVEISESNLEKCREKMPDIADHFQMIDPKPSKGDMWYGGGFDVVIGNHAFYYYNDTDLEIRLETIYNMLKPGGIIYATMMGTKMTQFHDNSKEVGDGLSVVNFKHSRFEIKDYYMNFMESEQDLLNHFKLFKKLHLGWYADKYREDEKENFHYNFVGIKE
ncbi:MAG: class I SAM-dependent methyltransferase [bacterium]|nr:class I SAM-dependent methyltransferase [bacterium]